MKIVFLGTPDFAVTALKSLLQNHYEVIAVITQPDKPIGRKAKLCFPPVKQFAVDNNLKVFQYNSIRKEGVEDLKALNPDIMVTCAFGQILSQEIIDIAKFGILNIHASLLPKYRGSSPIQWSIINGETKTGVTIMRTDIGIDTGDILLQRELEINKGETSESLFERLSLLGGKAIIEALTEIEKGVAVFKKQNHEESSHFPMLKKTDGEINWNSEATKIVNLIRGLNPWPTAFSTYKGEVIKIWTAEEVESSSEVEYGTVIISDIKNGLVIKAKENAVKVLELQISGGKRMLSTEYLKGRKIEIGSKFN